MAHASSDQNIVAIPAFTDVVYSIATSEFIAYPAKDTREIAAVVPAQNATPEAAPPRASEEDVLLTSRMELASPLNDNHCKNCGGARRVSLQKNVAFIWNVMADKAGWNRIVLFIVGFIFVEAPLNIGTLIWPQFHILILLSIALQLGLSVFYHWVVLKTFGSIDKFQLTLVELTHRKIATMIMT